MKSKLISGIILLSLVMVSALLLDSCKAPKSDSSDVSDLEETGSNETEIPVVDSQKIDPEGDLDTLPIGHEAYDELEETETILKPDPVSEAAVDPDTEGHPEATLTNSLETVESPTEVIKDEVMNPVIETEAEEVIDIEETVIEPVPETEVVETSAPDPKAELAEPAVSEVSEPEIEEVVEAVAVQAETVEETTTNNWPVPAEYLNKINPISPDGSSKSRGKTLYKLHCASCHGKYGEGDGPKSAQLDTPSGDITLPSFQSQSDGALFYKTWVGRDEMPRFSKKLPDEDDIWDIVNYMRTFKD